MVLKCNHFKYWNIREGGKQVVDFKADLEVLGIDHTSCVQLFLARHSVQKKRSIDNKIVLEKQWQNWNLWEKDVKREWKEVLLVRVFPLVRLTGQWAYVSWTKVFPTPCPCLPYEWLNPIIWYLIWNFFFPKVSLVPIFFQYNLVCLTPNFWRCDSVKLGIFC